MKTFPFLFLDHFNDTAKFFSGPLNKFFTFIGSIRPKFSTCTIRKKISIIKDYSLTARGSQHAQYHSQHQRGV